MKLLLVSTVFVFFLLTGCKKKDTPVNFLTTNTWKWSLTDQNPSTNPTGGTLMLHAVQQCELDDTFNFGTNGDLTINRGANKCDPNEAATDVVAYTIDRVNHVLTIDGTTFTLAEESPTQIKYYAALPGNSAGNYMVFLLEKI